MLNFKKVYTPKSIDEIIAGSDGLTDLKFQNRVKGNIGKWLKVEGELADISVHTVGWTTYIYLQMYQKNERLNFNPHFMLTFSKKWLPQLEEMDVGDHLYAEGKIYRIRYLSINLKSCRLIPTAASNLTIES